MKGLKAIIILLFVLFLLTGCACKHEETRLVNVVAATCQKEGYSGDTFCVECGEVILQGENVKMRPHTEGKVINVKESTCTTEGYTGDIFCAECGMMLNEGETIPALGHTEGDLVDVHEATCYDYGYTGNVYCTECNELLIAGHTIPMLSHDLELQGDAYEATCEQTGYSGTSVCKICNAFVYGETLPTKQHNYVNNSCTWCGWLNPGLYFEDELAMSWKDMEKNGYVTVSENGQLIAVNGDFSGGKLVIGEDVVYVDGNN